MVFHFSLMILCLILLLWHHYYISMIQESGIYLCFCITSEPLILLGEINLHMKYVYRTGIEEFTFPSRIHRTSITYSEVYFNAYGLIWDYWYFIQWTAKCYKILGLSFFHHYRESITRGQKNNELKILTKES